MSGLNFFRGITTFPYALAIAATLAPSVASAASTTHIIDTTHPDRYHVNVPATFDYNTTGAIRPLPGSVTGPNQLSFSGVTNANYVTGSGQTIQLGQFVVNPVKDLAGNEAVTTYRGTPFIIQIRSPEFDKSSEVPLLAKALPTFGKTFHLKTETLNSLLIRGHLDGTVNSSGQSNVTATVDSTRLGAVGVLPKNTAVNYTFPVQYGNLKLPTSWAMNTTGNALASTNATAASTTTGTGTATAATTSIGSSVPASAAAQILANPAAEMLTATPLGDPTPTPEPTAIVIFAAAGAFLWSRQRSR